jgi:hypothetical protein
VQYQRDKQRTMLRAAERNTSATNSKQCYAQPSKISARQIATNQCCESSNTRSRAQHKRQTANNASRSRAKYQRDK